MSILRILDTCERVVSFVLVSSQVGTEELSIGLAFITLETLVKVFLSEDSDFVDYLLTKSLQLSGVD